MKTESIIELLTKLGFTKNKKEQLVTYTNKLGKVSVIIQEKGYISVISNIYSIEITIYEHTLTEDHIAEAVRLLNKWLE